MLAAHILRYSLERDGRCRVVSTDRIRVQLFGDEIIQGAWGQIWREIGRQFEQCSQSVAGNESSLVIYDATNVMRRYRRDVIKLARAAGFTSIVGLWLDEAVDVCLGRNRRRSRQVPDEIILRMHRQIQGVPPSLDEGFDELIRYASSSEALSAAASALNLCIETLD